MVIINKQWQQRIQPYVKDITVPLQYVHTASSDIHYIDSYKKRLLNRIKLNQAPWLHAVYVQQPKIKTEYLILVAHHLIIDAVSWDVLLYQIEDAYEGSVQVESKVHDQYMEWLKQTSKNSANKQYSRHERSDAKKIKKQTYQETINKILSYSRVASLGAATLNTYKNKATHQLTFSKKQTLRLHGNVHKTLNTTPEILLLVALVRSLISLAPMAIVNIDIESHGRDSKDNDFDLFGIVGWLTQLSPLSMHLSSSNMLIETIIAVKENYYAVKRSKKHSKNTRPLIAFNYLGGMTQSKLNLFDKTGEYLSLYASESLKRLHLLTFNCFIIDKKLSVHMGYCKKIFRPSDIKKISDRLIKYLNAILRVCENSRFAQFTPADFPLLKLPRKKYSELLEVGMGKLYGSAENIHKKIQTIYPLLPIQEGFYFHKQLDPSNDHYYIQSIYRLVGNVKPVLIEKACNIIVNTFVTMRTGFIQVSGENPVQFILRRCHVALHCHDLSAYDSKERQSRLDELINIDRQQRFDFSKPPLIRFYLIKLADEQNIFIIGHHHILLGGWSAALLMKHFFDCYDRLAKNKSYTAPAINSYEGYIRWIKSSNQFAARKYWRKLLEGFEFTSQLTLLPPHKHNKWLVPGEHHYRQVMIPRSLELNLKTLANRHKKTLNIIIQSAWVLLLMRYCQSRDIVYGVTASGRPNDLEGAESIIGPIISTLPGRISIKDDSARISSLFESVHDASIQRRRYLYTRL